MKSVKAVVVAFAIVLATATSVLGIDSQAQAQIDSGYNEVPAVCDN